METLIKSIFDKLGMYGATNSNTLYQDIAELQYLIESAWLAMDEPEQYREDIQLIRQELQNIY
jgi:hypothetical protein